MNVLQSKSLATHVLTGLGSFAVAVGIFDPQLGHNLGTTFDSVGVIVGACATIYATWNSVHTSAKGLTSEEAAKVLNDASLKKAMGGTV